MVTGYNAANNYGYGSDRTAWGDANQNYYGGGQYQIPGVDPTKTPLGRGEMDQDLIAQIMQLNPQFAQLFAQSQQGFDPMVQGQLNNLPGLQQQMLQGSMFGDAEKQTYQDLISGKTLAGQGGTLYDMIQQQFAPKRDEARSYAAAMGLTPSSGAGMSYQGNIQGAQDKSFAENMVNKYLAMVGVGSEGLGAMDLSSLQRQQGAGQLGQWLSEFVTGQQNQKTQMGANITQMQQNPLMQLLGLSQNQNQFEAQNRGQGFDLGSLASLIPTALSFINPAAGMGSSALMNMFGNQGANSYSGNPNNTGGSYNGGMFA